MLEGKVVIVTGAGGGLGEGIARVCHREGAAVVIADIRGTAAEGVASSLADRAIAVTADVSSQKDRVALVDATLSAFGRVDGLVNNAGINFVKPFLQTTQEEWDKIISVDLTGVFFLTQLVCRHLVDAGRPGSIVNISSVHSHAALPGAGPYDAAKWGVVGMSKSMAIELAPQGIRINAVSPGLVNTQIWQDVLDAAPDEEQCKAHFWSNIPIGRPIEPAEIGELTAFLLSDRSGVITGSNFIADGGMHAQLMSREPYESAAIGADA